MVSTTRPTTDACSAAAPKPSPRAADAVAPRHVLASASPRRSELLGRLGLDFEVRPANVDETPGSGESPPALVARLAVAKAEVGAQAATGGAVVLGADTIVAVDDDVLGKPANAAHAAAML